MNSPTQVIRERSEYVPIKPVSSLSNNNLSPKGEYSLKQFFFDPTKCSPPNNFMSKLQKRMSVYNSAVHSIINDANLESE